MEKMNPHLKLLLERHPSLKSCSDDISAAFDLMVRTYDNSGKAFICGNGGSAADAEHWSGELLKGFLHKRPLSKNQREGMPEALAGKLQSGLPMIPLTSFIALNTAFANDVDADLIFAQLTYVLGEKDDVLIGLSTSGNSRNVVHAFETAKARGLVTLALTGSGGGKLAEIADVCIRVPDEETFCIQELHLPVYHTLCIMLEEKFFGPCED